MCSICKAEKELSEFYCQSKKKSTGDEYIYYQPYCKECAINKATKSYESNREIGLIYRKIHRYSNKEYYKEKQREFEIKNLERRKKYKSNWQKEHPEKIREYNIYRQMNKKHDILSDEWDECKKYFNHRCAYCDLKIEDHFVLFKGEMILTDLHKEHVIHDGSNDLSNCVPACKTCNVQKRTIPFLEWYSSENDNFDQDRFDKILQWITEDFKLYIEKQNYIKGE